MRLVLWFLYLVHQEVLMETWVVCVELQLGFIDADPNKNLRAVLRWSDARVSSCGLVRTCKHKLI